MQNLLLQFVILTNHNEIEGKICIALHKKILWKVYESQYWSKQYWHFHRRIMINMFLYVSFGFHYTAFKIKE